MRFLKAWFTYRANNDGSWKEPEPHERPVYVNPQHIVLICDNGRSGHITRLEMNPVMVDTYSRTLYLPGPVEDVVRRLEDCRRAVPLPDGHR